MEPADEVFKAIAYPARRRILHLLKKGPLTAGDIVARFSLSGGTVTHHCLALHHADLLTRRQRGTKVYYGINASAFEELADWATAFAMAPSRSDKNV